MFLVQGQGISAINLWQASGEQVRNKTAKFPRDKTIPHVIGL